MNHQTTSTPETDQMVAADLHHLEDDETCPASVYWRMVELARTLERERDQLRRWTSVNGVTDLERERDQWVAKAAELSAERESNAMQALTYKAERDEARKLFQSSKRARASLSEACDHLQAELSAARHALTPGGMLDIIDRAAAIRERDEAREDLQHAHKKLDAIQNTALEIIRGYGKTGLSTFTTPVSVMYRLRDEVNTLREELKSEQGLCDWEQTEDGQWLTDCGNAFEFTDGSPIYNDFICCPYCRKNLTETPYVDAADSDNTP